MDIKQAFPGHSHASGPTSRSSRQHSSVLTAFPYYLLLFPSRLPFVSYQASNYLAPLCPRLSCPSLTFFSPIPSTKLTKLYRSYNDDSNYFRFFCSSIVAAQEMAGTNSLHHFKHSPQKRLFLVLSPIQTSPTNLNG